jgi:hypothetical protein
MIHAQQLLKRIGILIGMLFIFSACQPYLTTADRLTIQRANAALEQLNNVNSLSMTITTESHQTTRISYMGQTINMSTDANVSGTVQLVRNTSGNYNIDLAMNGVTNLNLDGRRIGSANEPLDYGFIFVDNLSFFRMQDSDIFPEVSTQNQWIYADIDQTLLALPSADLDLLGLFDQEALEAYPLTENTVKQIHHPAAITVNGVQLTGYRFEVDMLAVFDESGMSDTLSQLDVLGELSELEELSQSFGEDFDSVAFLDNMIRDFFKNSRFLITLWLDSDHIIRRIDTDITIRSEINMMGMRLRIHQTSQESVTYDSFNEPITITRPL